MITPESFKEKWLKESSEDKWYFFNELEIEKSPLAPATKSFLKIGFPESAAPFLGFGWRSYQGRFYSIKDYYRSDYDLEEKKGNYWILGGDNYGDAICFDIANNDRIVILDHEQEFDLRKEMNKDISELGECLLAYREFVLKVRKENGNDAFIHADFTDDQFDILKNSFSRINEDLVESWTFWGRELRGLIGDREFYKKKKQP